MGERALSSSIFFDINKYIIKSYFKSELIDALLAIAVLLVIFSMDVTTPDVIFIYNLSSCIVCSNQFVPILRSDMNLARSLSLFLMAYFSWNDKLPSCPDLASRTGRH